MIKKIICIFAALAMCLPLMARAQSVSVNDGSVTIEGYQEDVILAGYDENGVLAGSQYVKYSGGKCVGHEIEGAAEYVVTVLNGFTGDMQPNATESPAETEIPTAEPVATEAPTESPKATPTPFPAAYERTLDANYTFSVIKSVSSIVTEDGNAYRVEILRAGEESEYIVPDSAEILVTSDYYPEMEGKNAGALRAGDLVFFERYTRGDVKSMAFIYRPVRENLITSSNNYGVNFERLFSTNGRVYASPSNEPGTVIRYGARPGSGRYQYAFGAVMESGSSYFTLMNRTGSYDNAIEVDITRDTIVYMCDMSGRGGSVSPEISASSAIMKSYIPSDAYDEDGNVTFTDEGDYTYAFARIINGTATEVVIYTGYGE